MATYIRDLPSTLVNTSLLAVAPVAATANTTGRVLDLLNSDGRCTLEVSFGIVNTLTNCSVQVNESSDNSTYTAVANMSLINGTQTAGVLTVTNTLSPGNTTYWASFDRTKRYVQVNMTFTGANVNMNTVAYVYQGLKQF
jgi:hypothetical protein